MREWNGRNWQLFDLNIIAHFLAKRIFDKSANFEKYSLREIDSLSLGLSLRSHGNVDSPVLIESFPVFFFEYCEKRCGNGMVAF